MRPNSPDIRPVPSSRSQEQENQIFESLLDKYGAYGLEAKIQKLDTSRKFYRRYPYDAWSKRADMDAIDIVHTSNPLKEIIAEEARNELLGVLTNRERWVATRSEEGYKPRDMAEMRHSATSNADRWIKHNVKHKFIDKLSKDEQS